MQSAAQANEPSQAAGAAAPVLRAAGLSKRYGKRQVVDGVDLEVRRGDVFGFLGPNGAGKSTTIRMLTGLVRPDAGTVAILGHDLHRRPQQALARVGAVVEAPELYPHLSGDQNLAVLAALSGGASPERRREVLRLVGLEGRAHDRVRTYSHGMKQRLALAQALLPQPELILLDEPTNGLDPGGMVEVRQLIRRLAAEGSPSSSPATCWPRWSRCATGWQSSTRGRCSFKAACRSCCRRRRS